MKGTGMSMRHSRHPATRLHVESRMTVPVMTGLRSEMRKEAQFESLAEAFHAQTMTRIPIARIETTGQLVVLAVVHLIAFGLLCCCAPTQSRKTKGIENPANLAARLPGPLGSLRFSLIDQFLFVSGCPYKKGSFVFKKVIL